MKWQDSPCWPQYRGGGNERKTCSKGNNYSIRKKANCKMNKEEKCSIWIFIRILLRLLFTMQKWFTTNIYSYLWLSEMLFENGSFPTKMLLFMGKMCCLKASLTWIETKKRKKNIVCLDKCFPDFCDLYVKYNRLFYTYVFS